MGKSGQRRESANNMEPGAADQQLESWNPARRRAFLKALREWSATSGRRLPWRNCGDPYRVWISEIMLQQTTVAAVVPYFERFLARFPTLETLAAADEGDVLRLWEGLGYYSRARNIHATAKRLFDDHSGQFPSELDQLLSLPGVGRYTAGAIASFGFNVPAPIVEANTQRLYARILGEDREVKSPPVQRALWSFAERLVGAPTGGSIKSALDFGPGAINQALMDLGALVCTPTNPACELCPVRQWCAAFAKGSQHEIPRLPARPVITSLDDVTVAVRGPRGVLLRKRGTDERWARLWDFPRYTLSGGALPADALTAGVLEQTGLTMELGEQIAEFHHSVTRYRIRLRCYLGEVIGGDLKTTADLQWVSVDDLNELALSVTGRKFADRLQQSLFRDDL